MPREAKTDHIYLRVRTETKQAFIKACEDSPGGPSGVLRWLLTAYSEGRVTVTPKQKED